MHDWGACASRLIARLREWKDLPDADPNPFELGFPPEVIATVTAGGLHSHARAVRKWRSDADHELGGRRLNATRRKVLLGYRAELDILSERVADLHRLLADPTAASHPLRLTAPDEAELAAAQHILAGRVAVPAVDWLARLIAWIAGSSQCRRFLTTVRDALSFPDEHAAREAVGRFAAIVAEAVKRLDALAPRPEAHKRRRGAGADGRVAIRRSAAIPALRAAFEELPESACGPNRIVLPTRDGEIDFHLLRDRCALVLKGYPPLPKWFHLAQAAALVLTDGASTAVAWSAVQCCKRNLVNVEALLEQANEPGYERLLGVLGELTFDDPLYPNVRRLLHAGATVAELNWWGHKLGEHLPAGSDERALRPVRDIAEWCAKHGSALVADDFAIFWKSAAAPSGRIVAESLARFLGWLKEPAAQQVAEVGGLIRLLSLPAFRQSLVERLRRWSEPPPRTRLPDDCPDGLPAELIALLRRLAFYRRSAGESARLPKSLRKPLETTARAESEAQHLRGLGAAIAPKQAERLRRLERRGAEGIDSTKLIRQAREVTAITALAAAKAIIRAELVAWWKARFATDPELDRFRWEHLYHLMHWADGLTESGRRLVDAIVVAHRERGPHYRIHLPHNRAWLDAAIAAGLDADQWFRPPAVRHDLPDGGAVTIAIATDPRDLFLMGSRFGTCLSLDDGVNRNAVIPNAADANKAVVYAFAADGEALARKLVGIAGGRLIGFDLYGKRASDDVASWVDEFCGAWAARAGLKLGDAGLPANLSGEFWYDDGERAWLPAAREAHRALRPDDGADEPPPVEDHGIAVLRDALRSEDPAALESLLASDAAPKPAALFWHIVRHPQRSWNRWDGVDPDELFRHLAARGPLRGRADPRSWPLAPDDADRFRATACRCVFDLIAPEPEALLNAADLLIRMPSAPMENGDTRFETSGPPLAVGLLPFATLLDVLRQFTRWMPGVDPDCPADARPVWADRLTQSWRRGPNLAAALRALSDPIVRVREVMQLFCVRERVPELLRQLRRQVKGAATPWNTETHARHTHDPARPFADRIADARIAAESALDGCGAAWYVAFSAEERAEVPLEIRTRFALGLMGDADGTANSLWPFLGWLATLPEDDRRMLWAATDPDRAVGPLGFRLLHTLDDYWFRPAGAILIQALGHADPALRAAAGSAYEAAAGCDGLLLKRMLDRAAPWVHPDIFGALAAG